MSQKKYACVLCLKSLIKHIFITNILLVDFLQIYNNAIQYIFNTLQVSMSGVQLYYKYSIRIPGTF